jgi:3D (Asp-Asp-Asp) domain-containing protein
MIKVQFSQLYNYILKTITDKKEELTMNKFNVFKLIQFIVIIGIVLSGGLYFNNLKKQNIIEKQRLQAIHEEEVKKLEVEKECYVQKLVHKDNEVNEYKAKLEKHKEKIQMNDEKFENILIECANLENTIKQLSFAGKKPRNYKVAEKVNRGSFGELYDNLEYVGESLITFYCPDEEECGKSDGITASGKHVVAGYTVAADPKYYKFGQYVYIEGWGRMEITDVGGAIKGEHRFDICTFDKNIARSGSHKMDVWKIND